MITVISQIKLTSAGTMFTINLIITVFLKNSPKGLKQPKLLHFS